MALQREVEEAVARLVRALRVVAPGDPYVQALSAVVGAKDALRELSAAEAERRLADVTAALAGARSRALESKASTSSEASEDATAGDASKAPGSDEAGSDEAPEDAPSGDDGRSPLQRRLGALADALPEVGGGLLPQGAEKMLRELALAPIPEGPEAVRFFLAAVVALDQLALAARYLPCEAAVGERVLPLQAEADAGASELGAKVFPSPGQETLPAESPGPVKVLAAVGEAEGGLACVEQRGFVLPEGKPQGAVVRVVSARPPAYYQVLLDGYGALAALRDKVAGGAKSLGSYRGWLDAFADSNEEQRGTTLRYAATAVYPLLEVEPRCEALYQRFVQALEALSVFAIPFDPGALHDEKRYELVVRKGAGEAHVIRPGFQGANGMVQQRVRVLADPDLLGSPRR